MNETPTPEQIAKLPKKIQAYIEKLDRRAVVAERTLKEFYEMGLHKIFLTKPTRDIGQERYDEKQEQKENR